MNRRHDDIEVTPSSGNVFADLDVPNPEEELLKADIAIEIMQIVESRGWSHAQAAEVVGLDQQSTANLLRGRLSEFSLGRLLVLLNRLGFDVTINAQPATGLARLQASIGV